MTELAKVFGNFHRDIRLRFNHFSTRRSFPVIEWIAKKIVSDLLSHFRNHDVELRRTMDFKRISHNYKFARGCAPGKQDEHAENDYRSSHDQRYFIALFVAHR